MKTPTLGILHDFRQPLPHSEPYSTYYAECLDEVVEADRLGFAAVWMSEHHLTPDGLMPSPLVMAAAIAARTSRISIGTSILVLPFHHPLHVAENAAVVDLLSGGRLSLGVGQGYAEREFAAFGVQRRWRSTLMEEAVEVIRQALSVGRVTVDGRHWSLHDIPVTPSPRRHVPIYVGGVTEPALRRAVRIGDGVIIYCATPEDMQGRAAVLNRVIAQSSAAGRTASVPLICTGVLHVAEDADRAWAEAAPGLAYLEDNIAAYSTQSPARTTCVAHALRQDRYLVGTPEQVTARLIQLHQELHFDHFAYWARLPGLSHTRAMESLNLVASRVMPALRGASGSCDVE